MTVVNDYKAELPKLIDGYSPSDVFNGDELGLYYRALPKKTLATSGDDCAGGKDSKLRLTVFLCASMTGEKVKPLAIV